MVYVLTFEKPFQVKVYSSLVALMEDNDLQAIGASKSKLEKWDFNTFDYVSYKVFISKRKALTSGDVRRNKAKRTETQAADK